MSAPQADGTTWPHDRQLEAVRFLEWVSREVSFSADATRKQLMLGYPNDTLASMVRGIQWEQAGEHLGALEGMPADVVDPLRRILRRELSVGTVEQIDGLFRPAVHRLRDAWEERQSQQVEGESARRDVDRLETLRCNLGQLRFGTYTEDEQHAMMIAAPLEAEFKRLCLRLAVEADRYGLDPAPFYAVRNFATAGFTWSATDEAFDSIGDAALRLRGRLETTPTAWMAPATSTEGITQQPQAGPTEIVPAVVAPASEQAIYDASTLPADFRNHGRANGQPLTMAVLKDDPFFLEASAISRAFKKGKLTRRVKFNAGQGGTMPYAYCFEEIATLTESD